MASTASHVIPGHQADAVRLMGKGIHGFGLQADPLPSLRSPGMTSGGAVIPGGSEAEGKGIHRSALELGQLPRLRPPGMTARRGDQ